jgi:hypothetical protein
MALARFVLTATVTVAAGTLTPNGYGGDTTPGGVLRPVTYVRDQVIYADSSAGSTGPGNLRAYVQGQDDVGHAALAN